VVIGPLVAHGYQVPGYFWIGTMVQYSRMQDATLQEDLMERQQAARLEARETAEG
jgi:hypothetical protein